MRFTCSLIPLCKWQCTSRKILVTTLVFLAVSSVSSLPSKGGYECPNCSGQYIKTIDPSTGKCVECWPCTKCLDGSGLSVPCGSTVNVGTKIHCVLCVREANFSDSSVTGQCQPCGVCAGKHERVLQKCTPESDVKCDCEVGFYRNKTTNKCLPCHSCSSCSNDDEIISKCREDRIENSQHQKPSSSSYGTSLLTVVDIHSSAAVKPSRSTVLATSSSLVTSSYLHTTITPKLVPGLTKMVPVPSRTQQIKATATSTSFLEWSKYDQTPTQSKPPLQVIYQKTHKSVHTNILIAVLTIVCVFILICTFCVLYYKAKKLRRRRLINDPRNQIVFSKIKQNEQGLNEPGNIEKTSDPSQIQRGTGKHVANQGAICGYLTPITLVPSTVIREMCRLLDLDRVLIDGNDYTRLGSELGLDSTQIQTLKQKCDSPSYVLLTQVFPAMPNSGTLGHLIPLLNKMGRHDVIQVIDKWVDSQKCTQVAQV